MNLANSKRMLKYNDAINEATSQAMTVSDDVYVIGQLVDYKAGVFGTTSGLVQKFGKDRVQDVPVAEAAISSISLGMAISGLRPVVVHHRLDHMIYTLDSIVNWISLWYFKSNKKSTTPITIRAIIGKGWGQGPQHSKSLHSWFAGLPGFRVAMPATAYDAKGLLLESIFGEAPTLILESRSLFSMESKVPEEMYRVRFGKAVNYHPGTDITLVAIASMVPLALRAAVELKKEDISVEVLDPRTIAPLDRETICASVKKTGRLLVADPGWSMCGFASEIISSVSERMATSFKIEPTKVTYPDSHTPMTKTLEEEFYPSVNTIVQAVRKMVRRT